MENLSRNGMSNLVQVREVQLRLLDLLDGICDKYGLSYWLDYGTLLGAYRHGGFIPWDDDIDVSMPAKDYKKFLCIAQRELPDDVLVQDLSRSPNPRFNYAKLRDLKSFFCESETDVRIPCGVFIDIFPATKSPRLPSRFVNLLCWFQYTCGRHAGLALSRLRRSPFFKIWDCLICIMYRSVKAIVGGIYSLLYCIAPSNNWRAPKDLPDRFIISNDDIFPLTKHSFEGRAYSVPQNAEKVLELEFGNWRQLPPPEKRFYHATIMCVDQTPPSVDWAKRKG